ncbi:hypothetical protein DSM104299_05108 [Baekduia alba]|nr:hypothetical protein DSM104299_05108 [Baekduia alba]
MTAAKITAAVVMVMSDGRSWTGNMTVESSKYDRMVILA